MNHCVLGKNTIKQFPSCTVVILSLTQSITAAFPPSLYVTVRDKHHKERIHNGKNDNCSKPNGQRIIKQHETIGKKYIMNIIL